MPEAEVAVDPWMDCMRRGDYPGAWRISDAALQERAGICCTRWPRHHQFIWDGSPLAGRRVLVRCYHGLGDTIQFIRYAALLKANGCTVMVWAQPVLLPLLRSVRGIDELLPLHDGTPEADYDLDVEIMELPHIFRSTLETLPAVVPYLKIPPAALPLDGRLRVGVVEGTGDWDRRRALPPGALAPLLEVRGINFFRLRRCPAQDDWPHGTSEHKSHGVLHTAAIMRAMDLVITTDSFPAHLSGALGVPTWTLLHADPDWRWMLSREDSPWYPTMRLFRQPQAGDWRSAVRRIAEELRTKIC